MPTVAYPGVLLTVREAATRLRVSEDTIRRRIANSELPAVLLGGPGTAVRIDERQLQDWLYGPPRSLR